MVGLVFIDLDLFGLVWIRLDWFGFSWIGLYKFVCLDWFLFV